MKIIICQSSESLAEKVAKEFEELIKINPKAILGLASGSSPIPTYKLLQKANLDWSQVKTFNLDEYMDVTPESKVSYRYFMNVNLFDHININKNKTYFPLNVGDLDQNGLEYEKLIALEGGIDLQLLGLGVNGHIGFNEPGTPLDKPSGKVKLSESTIESNSRFFESKDQVPKYAISTGIKAILQAKKIILIATGEAKSEAIKNLVEGDVSVNNPASFLKNHDNASIYVDIAAASKLKIKNA